MLICIQLNTILAKTVTVKCFPIDVSRKLSEADIFSHLEFNKTLFIGYLPKFFIQERTCVIVMTTKEMERGKPKCAKYWPGQHNF
jgi:hypothetical protein